MRFSKMQGVGNDFVVLDAGVFPAETDWADVAVRLCARRFGIGADGLLTVSRSASSAALFMRMFNPDGTEDMCGNGLRCAGLWAQRAGWLGDSTEFVIATKDGPKPARLTEVAADGRSARLSIDMGLPQFSPDKIPVCAPAGTRIVDYPLTVADKVFAVTSMNTGSTHTVIFGDIPEEATFQCCSPLIENHPLFPERTTVLWATPDGPNRFQVRIWERGVGETLGCGTGACAVGVASRLHRRSAAGTPITVASRGGELQIDWPGEDAAITMTGPAEFVFDGEIPSDGEIALA